MANAITTTEPSHVEKVEARPSITPRVDIFENEDELLLIADVPGVAEKDFVIHLDKDQLTLDARRGGEPTGAAIDREFRPVDYRRTFVVPSSVDPTKISAEVKAGILRLHLPKADDVKPRRIAVKPI